MAYEDFSDASWVEVDSASDIVKTDTDTITVTTMANTAVSWVYKDYGADHFGDFEHLIDVNLTAASVTPTNGPIVIIWGFSNDNTKLTNTDKTAGSEGVSVFLFQTTTNPYPCRVYLRQHSGPVSDYVTLASIPVQLYLTIARNGTTYTCDIYSDASRETLITDGDLTIEGATTAYRYLQVVGSKEATGTETLSCVIENLDIQEAAPPAPTGPQDCDNPGRIALNTTNYGNELYVQTTNYGNELRQHSTCS